MSCKVPSRHAYVGARHGFDALLACTQLPTLPEIQAGRVPFANLFATMAYNGYPPFRIQRAACVQHAQLFRRIDTNEEFTSCQERVQDASSWLPSMPTWVHASGAASCTIPCNPQHLVVPSQQLSDVRAPGPGSR
jgi:hypothetical protein